MNCWMHSSRNPIRLKRRALLGIVLVSALLAASATAQKRDYFTELEISDIRDAQEVEARTIVLLEIATRRLAGLGLIDAGGDDSAEEPGFGSKLGRVFITILSPEAAGEIGKVEEERAARDHDLSGHTRPDLLRGYYQALDETMDNIDDAYERNRGDITASLRALRDFSRDALGLLEDAATASEDEHDALEDAIEQTRLALEGATQALETLPRNDP